MIEVFKTNVEAPHEATKLLDVLSHHIPHCNASFDLEDCDRILRVEGTTIPPGTIIEILDTNGYQCLLLD